MYFSFFTNPFTDPCPSNRPFLPIHGLQIIISEISVFQNYLIENHALVWCVLMLVWSYNLSSLLIFSAKKFEFSIASGMQS